MKENLENKAKDEPNAEPIIKLENELKENFDFRFNEVLKQIEFRNIKSIK